MTDMYLWTCTDHDSVYPVGCASLVIAETEERAEELLNAALQAANLDARKAFTLKRHPVNREYVEILNDGDY